MAGYRRKIRHMIAAFNDNDRFLGDLDKFVQVVAKILSLGILLVILMSVYEVGNYMFFQLRTLLFSAPDALLTDDPAQIKKFGSTLFTIFGLFLNVLIAIEILENITAYLRKHVVQVELVIVTSLIAVARKIIILDLEKTGGLDLAALAATILALAIAYWVVRRVNPEEPPAH